MAFKYDIKAIPTLYNGRTYRSRLEAKWAAFFDRVGWRFEYEPMDLGEWSPDFALCGARTVLVEVKPIADRDIEVCNKIDKAAFHAKRSEELLLLGFSPILGDYLPWGGSAIGWLNEPQLSGGAGYWAHASLGVVDGTGTYDFSHEFGVYAGRMSGCGYREAGAPTVAAVRERWGDACDEVQWHKRR